MPARYACAHLLEFAEALFRQAGMPQARAAIVAQYLVEADLMGHDTHGLNLAPGYLGVLASGAMPKDGEPEVVADRGAVLTLDGRYLSGVWLTVHAIDRAVERARLYGSGTVSIRRSHHIACLAAYLERATSQGMLLLLMSSDPANGGVAPFGSYQPTYTPDPIAVGIPTRGEPVLVDISASATTLGLSGRLAAKGERLPAKWLIDNRGEPSDDPAVLKSDPPGAILPLGGMDRGHKGFGLGLMVEALTSGLNGFGRAMAPKSWGASVFVQAFDPSAFGGLDAFLDETTWLAEACRAAAVPAGRPPVRLPGEGAFARKRKALGEGVPLHPDILPQLAPVAAKLGVPLPSPLG